MPAPSSADAQAHVAKPKALRPEWPAGPLAPASAPALSETHAARTEDAVLDSESLERLRELDPRGESRLLERVVAAYVSSAEKLLSQLTDAESRHDSAGIRLVAHTLKSSSASVGAMALSKVCGRVEAIARDEGDAAGLAAAVADLRWHLDEALVALSTLSPVASRPTGPAG